jgi:hypothetical protein
MIALEDVLHEELPVGPRVIVASRCGLRLWNPVVLHSRLLNLMHGIQTPRIS